MRREKHTSCVAAGGADADAGARMVDGAMVGAVGAVRHTLSRLVVSIEDREEDAPPRSLAIGWLSVPGPEPEPRLTAMCRFVDHGRRDCEEDVQHTHTAQHAWRGLRKQRVSGGARAR